MKTQRGHYWNRRQHTLHCTPIANRRWQLHWDEAIGQRQIHYGRKSASRPSLLVTEQLLGSVVHWPHLQVVWHRGHYQFRRWKLPHNDLQLGDFQTIRTKSSIEWIWIECFHLRFKTFSTWVDCVVSRSANALILEWPSFLYVCYVYLGYGRLLLRSNYRGLSSYDYYFCLLPKVDFFASIGPTYLPSLICN